MTRTEIIELAMQCGMNASPAPGDKAALGRSVPLPWLEAFFHAAQSLEREACANVCDGLWYFGTKKRFAAAIRNRIKT